MKIDDPLGARLQRGSPTIACIVTAGRSEHPEVVLHSLGKKTTLFDNRARRAIQPRGVQSPKPCSKVDLNSRCPLWVKSGRPVLMTPGPLWRRVDDAIAIAEQVDV